MNNELIKEFARQSGFKVNFQHEDHQAIRMAQYTEFADLIVQECLRMIENEAAQYAEPVWALELINDIKDRFGVEELTTKELSKDADEWYEKLLWGEKK